MTQHKQFEIMCALAAVGQLSSSDLAGLSQHVEACADCQRRLSEFARLSAQALLLFGERYCNSPKPPVGMTARFVTRARAEGIPLEKSAGSQPREFLYSLGWRGNIAAVLLVLAVIAGISNRRHSPPFSASAIVAGANATGEGTLKPEAAQVRSSQLLKRTSVVRQAKSHHRFDASKGTADGAQPSEFTFTTSLGLAPSTARHSANCDQAEANQVSSLFSRVTEAREPSLFKAFVTYQQTRRVAPWLISLNSLPPLFVYATDQPSFLRSSQMGMSQPSVDLSKMRTGIFSGAKRLSQYQEVPEQRWPFSKEFKVGAR